MGSPRLVVALVAAPLFFGCAASDSLDESSASTDEAADIKTNGGFAGHYASPTIVRDGSTYHAYFAKQTIQGTSYNVPHATFTADGQFTFRGEALPHLGKHAVQDGVVWAPAAAKISDHRWMLYYTAQLAGTEQKKCIWRAHSTDAHGPFVDDYDEGPIVCLPGSLWAIDPYLVQGHGGHWYLVARLDEPGGINTIQIRRLDEHAAHFESGSSWKLLTRNWPNGWEQPVLENAAVVELTPAGETEGHWFVFYSAKSWDKDDYSIGYADCGRHASGEDHGPGKPRCTKITTDGPWLAKDPDKGVFGPGTPTFYTDEEGRTLMSVQAWQHAGGKSNPKNHGQVMLTYKVHVDDAYAPHVKLLREDL